MDPSKIREHEKLCHSQIVECLAGIGVDEIVKRGWKGRQSQLIGHVNQEYGLTMIHTKHRIEHTAPCARMSSYMQTALVCAHGDLFWSTLKLDTKKKKRYKAV
jgi:hypothetical protein